MSIRDSDVQRVREATDLVALIGRRVSLKRSGSRHVGLCPFHTEKTPSFSVDPAQGFYHCFGCKASGDAITFLRETEQLDFADAVEQLAAAANITLTYDAPGAQRANQRRKELMELLEAAARFYHERLLSSPDAGPARAYLRRRGYDRETVVKWRLGYAPPLWDGLCRHLGAPPAQLAAAGLAYADTRRGTATSSSQDAADKEGEAESGDSGSDNSASGNSKSNDTKSGSASDFFRDRIMFPICDASGRVVSFAGRLLPRSGEPAPKGPKYKNTAGTPVYDKSRTLYGMHLAKHAARTADRIVVCEGYTDVIGCAIAGIPESVATCGTALTQQHAEMLARSAKRIVLAFDADAAGQNATERVHQWERTYGLDIFVALLPPGSDPGDLAAANPPTLLRALNEPQPLRTFRADRILDRADLDSPVGRDRAANEVAEVFAVYPADVLIDADVEPIARRIPMGVDEFRKRVDTARDKLAERPAASPRDDYEPEDAPPPPEWDDGLHDSYSGDSSGDPYLVADPAASVGSRTRARGAGRDKSPEKLAADDLTLLSAAVAPEGDAAGLMVPELFATNVGKEAFMRLLADEHWRSAAQAMSSCATDPGADPVLDMLAAAAARGAALTSEDATDHATTAMWHFVRGTIRGISSGGDIPRSHIEPGTSASDEQQYRHNWVVWLRSYEASLPDLDLRVGAAKEIRDALDALGEKTTRGNASPDSGSPCDEST